MFIYMTKFQSNHRIYKSDIKPAIDHSDTVINNKTKHSPDPNSRGNVWRSYIHIHVVTPF